MRYRPLLALAVSLALAACGAPPVGAILGDGVRVELVDGEPRDAGAVPFGNGDALVAESAASARITCGGRLSETSTMESRLAPGLADLHLDAGARFRRREGSAFDLVDGSLRLVTGPVTSRIVVFHGTTFLEVATTNADGIDVRLSTDGPALTVEVSEGDVLLHATGATEKDLHYVKLAAGESAVAAPGEKPRKLDPPQDE